MDVVERRAAGVGGVRRVHRAVGQPPQKEAIDGAERKPPRLRSRPRAIGVVEDPGDLGGGEIGVEQQSRSRTHQALMAGLAKLLACRGGAPVLPDDGGRHGPAGAAIPDNGRLALVGNADGADLARLDARSRHRPPACGGHRRPQVFRLMPRPSRGADSVARIPSVRRPSRASPESKTIARVDVVPWSIANTWPVIAPPPPYRAHLSGLSLSGGEHALPLPFRQGRHVDAVGEGKSAAIRRRGGSLAARNRGRIPGPPRSPAAAAGDAGNRVRRRSPPPARGRPERSRSSAA